MAEWTPADTSQPGTYEIIATLGTSTATTIVTAVKMDINSLSVERGQNMSFMSSVNNGVVSFAAVTGSGLTAGANFQGVATLLPDGLSVSWELLFKQYFTRKTTYTYADGTTWQVIENGWDNGEIYHNDYFSISGLQELRSEDSPWIAFDNIEVMYNEGVRSGTFSDVFNLYFHGVVPVVSCDKELGIKNWGWSFSYSLSMDDEGQVQYDITDRQEIGEMQ